MYRSRPISYAQFLPNMLLSSVKKLPIMLNIMPITTAIIPRFRNSYVIVVTTLA